MAHAKKRALQRFGICLNRHDLKDMILLIQAGDAEFITRQSFRKTIFKVESYDVPMFAVYDSMRKTIATFLTEQMVNDNEWDDETPTETETG